MWELHVHVLVDGSLGVCGNIVHLLGLPSKSHDESQKKTDRYPRCLRCIGFVIVFSFSHPGAIKSKASFILLNLSGKNIPFAYQCPNSWEYSESRRNFGSRDYGEITIVNLVVDFLLHCSLELLLVLGLHGFMKS